MKKIKIITLGLVILVLSTSCGMQAIPTALNDVEANWAEVQNQYKRRADLVPNLVSVVKGYATHEKETLEAVITARANATKINLNVDQLTPETMKQFQEAQAGLSGALSKLMMITENYPDLKANQGFTDLQVQLEGTENRITVARNRYIEVINKYNKLITVPPTSWFNALFLHYDKKPQFAVENLNDVQNAPKIVL